MYSKEKIMQTLRDIVDESKEIEPYVVVAQPKRNATDIPIQTFSAYDLCHIAFTGYSYGYVDVAGQMVDVARNLLIEKVLESKAKYLFFIGDDTALPYDAFSILHKTAEENPGSVVCGVYYMKAGQAMIDVKDGPYVKVADVTPGQLFEAWQTGMDCMLIPVDILRDMYDPELPFCCVANGVEDIPFVGEDNFFVHRLRKAGYKLLVNTDVQCLHVDYDTGKYSAYPGVNLDNYFMNWKITEPLTIADKAYIERRWHERLPKNDNN